MDNINKKKRFFILSSFLIPLFILAGFFISPVKAEQANHVVISEVQIGGSTATDEFVELYNPTASAMNLAGWRLTKKTASGATVANLLTFFPDKTIPAFGYFLIAHPAGYDGATSADAVYSTAASLSSDNTLVLYSDGGNTVVDLVGLGAAANFEGAPAENPSVDGSIERKAKPFSTSEAMARGADKYLGNGHDTDNNAADFILQPVSGPQNSQSPAEPAIDASGNANFEAAPVSEIGGSNSSQAPAPTPAAQPISPLAEAGADKIAVAGEIIEFDGSDSFDPAGKDLSYSWFFGDGESGKGENVRHAYVSAGEYEVVLTVTNGAASGENSLKVKVSEPEFSDKIILSEILPDPKGLDKDGEWIELANIGGARINLRGWILDDKTDGGGKPYVFKKDVFVEPQGFLVVKRQESNIVLPNKGGEINLLWYNGKSLSKVSYGQSKEGQSYALIGGVWQWTSDITPEEKNILSQPVSKAADKTSGAKAIAGAGKEIIVSLAESASGGSREIASGNKEDSLSDTDVEEQAEEFADYQENNSLPAEKENSALRNNNFEINNKNLAAGGIGAIFGAGNKNLAQENNSETKNNPWFWGDMALSVLSLFLVWRYQEVKKKIR